MSKRLERTSNPSSATEAQWQTPGIVMILRVAVADLDGHSDSAAEMLRSMIEEHPFGSPRRWYYFVSFALCYRLLPEHRAFFDDQKAMGPLCQRDLALNQSAIAVTKRGRRRCCGVGAPSCRGE
ncbi:MAG: hypothetical protein ACJAXA_001986 [Candidatus Aldehydirespiratoraceae bacterium]|jgi:hypothetical protein